MALRSVLWVDHKLKRFKGLALAPALFLTGIGQNAPSALRRG
jgi:hypothetical protein